MTFTFLTLLLSASSLILVLTSVTYAVNVPKINDGLEEVCKTAGCNQLIKVWKESLEDMAQFTTGEDPSTPPHTILSPSDRTLQNYIPQDVPSPFHSNDEQDRNLTAKILKDFFIVDMIDPNDAKIRQKEGMKIKNLNGNEMILHENAAGEMTINGQSVMYAKKHDKGFSLIVFSGPIFDHFSEMSSAMRRLLRDNRGFNPWL